MTIKTPLFFLAMFFVIITAGCNQNQKKDMPSEPETSSQPENTGNDVSETKNGSPAATFFKGSGNEPFWNVELSEEGISFTSLIEGYESLSTPLPEVIRAADANIKRYRANTEKTQLDLTIAQDSCADTMADKQYGYRVTLEIRTGADTEAKTLSGCGDYLADPRLQDIWVLEQLGEETVQKEWFAKELPYMEINTSEKSFTGYAGCNQMRGSLFTENTLLRFTRVITTRKACIPGNREGDFLQNLNRVTSWKIENNRLWLSNPNGLQLVFRKAD
ncbi:META domain-containing protein [Robertkochia flava]|uniref:META domain-containing protein n=1 Tax=Robertkochia flava TaxID=3447986 RepID=UPI001CCFACFB|nr:META domain-containing protein [Robertkochia marina]